MEYYDVPARAHSRRDLPQWFNSSELEWTPASTPVGTVERARLLSAADDGSESATWQLDLPAGWSRSVALPGTIEIFVLGGELRAGDSAVGTGGFIAVPAGTASEISTASGTQVLLYSNPQLGLEDCYPDGQVVVAATRDLPWIFPEDGRGVAMKTLRVSHPEGGGRGGFLNLLLFLPGFVSPEVEFHNTWEEMFYLDGDFMMPLRGNAGVGTVHANPGGALHGPFASQFGSLMLHHALEPYRTDFAHLAGGLSVAGEYMDTEAFDAERPRTRRWDDAPQGWQSAVHRP